MRRWRVWMSGAGLLLLVTQMSAQSGQTMAPRDAAPARVPSQDRGTGNVERGAYLAQHVAMCVECHSARDGGGTIVPPERFMGGLIPLGPPWATDWAQRAPRIAGLPGYTNDQALRVLTQGAIDRTGRQLRLPMPRFRMTNADAADIVAFLKAGY